MKERENREYAICIIFAAVVIWILAIIGGTLYFIYSQDKIESQTIEIYRNRDTIHQLRLQVIELESEVEIKNHWEE